MITPGVAARRLGIALLLGAALGLWYGFLRPARRRHPLPGDIAFIVVAFWVWLYFGFGICRGDLRLWDMGGLAVGAVAWEMTLGKPLRRVFSVFWEQIGRFISIICLPLEKFLHFFEKIAKILLATVKKASTIRKKSQKSDLGGGNRDGEKESLAADPFGLPAQLPAAEMRAAGGHRIVYGLPDRVAYPVVDREAKAGAVSHRSRRAGAKKRRAGKADF
jgi:hypothetical protein